MATNKQTETPFCYIYIDCEERNTSSDLPVSGVLLRALLKESVMPGPQFEPCLKMHKFPIAKSFFIIIFLHLDLPLSNSPWQFSSAGEEEVCESSNQIHSVPIKIKLCVKNQTWLEDIGPGSSSPCAAQSHRGCVWALWTGLSRSNLTPM